MKDSKGYWDEENGWVGPVLRWWDRTLWCKLGLHRWGAPWCMECGAPDHILQESLNKVIEDVLKEGKDE